jgi:hypothetical protein
MDASLFLIRQFYQYSFWELVVMLFMPSSATMGDPSPEKRLREESCSPGALK